MGYRDERRADRAAEREQDREDKKLLIDRQLEAQKLAAEEKRRDEEFRRRQAQQEKRQKERAKVEARARRVEKFGRVLGWLKKHPVDVFVGFVMVASVVPAVISQVGALGHANVHFLLAALLAAMLEGGAWACTFMGKAAEDAGRETRKYRIATWCTAFVAAGVNFWHWAAMGAPLWVAGVFGASSLFAIFVWDMRTHGSHGPTRAERREERKRRKHEKQRRKDHKDEAKLADKLISAAPYGALGEEEAFAAAWRIRHGGIAPGMTSELYAASVDARLELGTVLGNTQEVSPHLTRTGLLTELYNPFPHRMSEGLRTLGATSPVPALAQGSEGATALAGIGVYGSEEPAGKAVEKKKPTGSGDGPGGRVETSRRGRSGEELEGLLPKAHQLANELVAEGKPISAASLAKGIGVRREDGMWLRDRVKAERKLRLVESGEQTLVKGA